jgi:hypothetical protein
VQHFHVIRWQSISLASGERIPTTDVDFAALSTAGEASDLASRVSTDDCRCTTYTCRDRRCTLHGPRGGIFSATSRS